MQLFSRLRRRGRNDDAPDSESTDETGEGPGSWTGLNRGDSWSAGTALRTTAVTVVVWGCVGAGVAGFGLSAFALATRTAQPVAVADTSGSVVRQQEDAGIVSGFAEQATRAWLSASTDNRSTLRAWFGGSALNGAVLPNQAPIPPAQVTAVRTTQTPTAGVWLVDVAVDGGVSWWEVPILLDGTHATALSIPGRIGAPAAADADLVTRPSTQVPPTSAAGQTVSGFLSALLAGSGDISRWTTPGSVIPAVTPAPYSDVKVSSITTTGDQLADSPSDGQTVDVQAIAATAQADRRSSISYGLRLKARGGRWEVFSYAAPFAAASPAPAGASPQTPTPSAQATP